MLPKVAAITMAYNETLFLPIWARHYGRQVGADQCYVVDHGSTASPLLPAGVNSIRLPRSPHDDALRAAFIADLTTSMLHYYDWVIYSDVDELVMADPSLFRDLPTFCAATTSVDTVTAIGLDIQHIPSLEPPLDFNQPVGKQRGWVRFTSAMCKPVLTRRPLVWAPGFHSSEHPIAFSGLYLFHLHWADLNLGLERARRTRNMAWAGDQFGKHQRMTDAAWLTLFQSMADLPRAGDVVVDPDSAPTRDWLERTRESSEHRAGQTFGVDLGINAAELWPIPPHFRERL
jgi:hypothetical protein